MSKVAGHNGQQEKVHAVGNKLFLVNLEEEKGHGMNEAT